MTVVVRQIGLVAIALAVVLMSGYGGMVPRSAQNPRKKQPPTFYQDILPVLQKSCQGCHRSGGIAPMPFETYKQTRPYAQAIKTATQQKSMPPWFADPKIGKFS